MTKQSPDSNHNSRTVGGLSDGILHAMSADRICGRECLLESTGDKTRLDTPEPRIGFVKTQLYFGDCHTSQHAQIKHSLHLK